MRGEDASNTAATPIPSQRRLTHQIIKHWKSFQILQQTLSSSTFTARSATMFALARFTRLWPSSL